MATARNLVHGLRVRIRNVDVDEGITWFLFLFVCALGVSSDEPSIGFSGMLPQVSVPQLNLVMVLLCLVVSIIIFIEPLLPFRVGTRTKNFRYSSGYQYLRRWITFITFILGWLTGFTMIIDTMPELSWLPIVIFVIGSGIFLVLWVRLVLAPWFELKQAEWPPRPMPF